MGLHDALPTPPTPSPRPHPTIRERSLVPPCNLNRRCRWDSLGFRSCGVSGPPCGIPWRAPFFLTNTTRSSDFSRARARTAAVSGTPQTSPTHFRRQPRVTTAPGPPPSTVCPPDLIRYHIRRPTLLHVLFPRLSPRPLRHPGLVRPLVGVPIPRFLDNSTPSILRPSLCPHARPFTSATSPASTLPSPSTPGETSLALSVPTPTSPSSPQPADTAFDTEHLRDCALSFTRTDWAAECRENVCAASTCFLSRGLHPHPMPRYKDKACVRSLYLSMPIYLPCPVGKPGALPRWSPSTFPEKPAYIARATTQGFASGDS